MVTKYSDGFRLDLDMEEVLGEILLLVSLSIIAALYASVGHGGASGYLAILSLTAYAANDPAWLKQHAWSLNLVVAGIAYLSFRKSGFVDYKLAIPFVITSIPAALLGGYLRVDDGIYDTLLSITLVFAAWKLYNSKKVAGDEINSGPPSIYVSLLIGGIIGFLSGIIGVGGGIFLSPLLILKGWGTAKTVAATSAVFIWANSFAGLLGVIVGGRFDLDISILGPFILCVILGGFVGAKFGAGNSSQNTIRRLLALVLFLAALRRTLGIFGLWV